MKYELIKKYPGSPELGTIESCSTHIGKGTKFYNSHPEFWRKLEEVDYEILSVYTTIDKVYPYKKNTFTGCFTHLINAEECFKIYSVKRLSDGEVFTIGDIISYKGEKLSPLGFIRQIDFKIWLDSEQNTYWEFELKNSEKYKTPLFTTEQENEIINIINKYR